MLLLFKAIGPDERWITVRPHGPGTEGTPVLIKPSADGSYHIIGGAGGSLNNLKLTGVRKEGEYTKELAERAKSRKEELKRRQQSDREHGLSQGKAAIREGIKASVGDQAYKFIHQVGDALGWSEDKLRFPEEKYSNVSAAAREAAEKKHGDALLKAAVEAVEFQRKRLVVDSEARAEAGLGEVPLTSAKPEDLSVQDLDPIAPETKGFGFAPRYGERAQAHGATEADIAAEASAAKPVDEKTAAAIADRKVVSQSIAEELMALQEPLPLDKAQMIDAKKAVDLMKAAKQFAAVRKQARAKLRELSEAQTIEPKAYVIETAGPPVDPSALAADLESDLRTLRTRGFLNEVGKIGPEANIGRHIGVGAYASVNALALAAGGASLLDRSVVDVLGVGGAAQVLVRRLRADLTGDEMTQITAAMGSFHIDKYMALSDESLREARSWHEMANEIELGEAENGNDLAVAQELNAKRREFIGNANRVLGTALGEMEANAALVVALGQPTKKQVQVSLGKTSVTAAIQQVRALGLDKGQYQVSAAGGSTILTVLEAGIDKLAAPVSKADLVATRTAMDIINGKQDEADWLPSGVADRPDLAMNVPAGVVPRLAKPFKVVGADMDRAVADYIGGRTADGDSPADIIKGLLSEETLQAAGDREAFIGAINAVAPLYGSDGRMTRVETYADKFNQLADDYVERTYGADRTPIQRQQFPVDRKSVDALHRALAEHPAGVAAFKPVGELTAQDQSALRAVFSEQYGRLDPKADALRQKVAALDKQEPPKEAEGLFGTGVNPEWTRWKAERDQAAETANAATMDWSKYVKVLGSPTAAYEAMADVIRGDVVGAFAQAHNKLSPKTPLILGRQVISHDIAHLDALDPAAREKRIENSRALIDSLRNRVAGRYASGSVADKQEAARAADVAASQAQMGLFGTADDEGPAAVARPLELGERHTIGHEAERQIAGMMSVVGSNFRPGQPIKLWRPTMSGKYIGRQRAVKLIEHNKRTMLGMGVGCVDGDTVLGERTFFEWWLSGAAPRVSAWDGFGYVETDASPVFIKDCAPMFEVTLAAGNAITVTAAHQFMTCSGWRKLQQLSLGAPVQIDEVQRPEALPDGCQKEASPCGVGVPASFPSFPQIASFLSAFPLYVERTQPFVVSPPLSSSEHGPSVRREGGPHSWRTVQDHDAHSQIGPSCDEQSPTAGVGGLWPSPSPIDVHERILQHSHQDGQDDRSEYNRSYQRSFRHSTLRSSGPFLPHADGVECDILRARLEPTERNKKEAHQLPMRSCHCPRTAPEASRGRPVSRSAAGARSEAVAPEFSPIVSIRPVGLRLVFDITVPVHSCYLANGILNHNSGKTSVMLSAFTDLKSKGQVHRGLFLVPSVVQGQFHGEALTMLEPGKFAWHADPSADRAARIAKYKDPKNDFSVVTHQGFRDDLLHMAAGSEGSTPEAVAEKLDKMAPDKRKAYVKTVLDREGIGFDYLAVDEGHNLLNRAGKTNSHMANVVDAVSGNTPYYVNSTADPVKNDASEIFDIMAKLRPDKYTDRDAFMRRYGVDTDASREGLKREMARSFYTGKIDAGVQANRQTVNVDVSAQRDQFQALDKAAAAGRLARLRGGVDVSAMKTLSPSSFAAAPAGMHEEIARALQTNLGIIHAAAIKHATDDGAKVGALAKIAAAHKGRAGVVFIHSLERVKQAAARLEAEGHRVVTLTGADSSAEKDRKKRDYKAGKYDVMVASDAAAVGANLQHGKWLVQFDTPNTAMLHAQRNGRVHRMGQTEDVDLIDLVANHPSEVRARERLATKYGLREVMTSNLEGLDETGVAGYLAQARAGTLEAGGKASAPTEADREAEAAPPARQSAML